MSKEKIILIHYINVGNNFVNEDGVNSVMNFTIVNSGSIVNSDTE